MSLSTYCQMCTSHTDCMFLVRLLLFSHSPICYGMKNKLIQLFICAVCTLCNVRTYYKNIYFLVIQEIFKCNSDYMQFNFYVQTYNCHIRCHSTASTVKYKSLWQFIRIIFSSEKYAHGLKYFSFSRGALVCFGAMVFPLPGFQVYQVFMRWDTGSTCRLHSGRLGYLSLSSTLYKTCLVCCQLAFNFTGAHKLPDWAKYPSTCWRYHKGILQILISFKCWFCLKHSSVLHLLS